VRRWWKATDGIRFLGWVLLAVVLYAAVLAWKA
jgi:hypothetical protein